MESSSFESKSRDVAPIVSVHAPVSGHPQQDSNSTAATEKDQPDGKVVASVASATTKNVQLGAKESAEGCLVNNDQDSDVIETNGESAVNKNNDKTKYVDKSNERNKSGEGKGGQVTLKIDSEKTSDSTPIDLPDSNDKSSPVRSLYQAALSQAAAFVKTTVLRQGESNSLLVTATNGNGVAAETIQLATEATNCSKSLERTETRRTKPVAETIMEINNVKCNKDIPLVNETKNSNKSSTKEQIEKAPTSTDAEKNQKKVKANKVVEEILAKQRKLKNFKVEKVAEGLPEGWIEHIHVRPQGRHKDHYWFTPNTGKRLRSRPEIERFLANLEEFDGDEDMAFNKLKGIKVMIKKIVNLGRGKRKVTSKKQQDESTTTRQPGRKTIKPTTQTKTTKVKSTKKEIKKSKVNVTAATKRKRETTPDGNNSKRQSKRSKDDSAKAISTIQKLTRKIKENKVSKVTPKSSSTGAKSRRIAESKQDKGTNSAPEFKRMIPASIAEGKTKGRTKILAKKLSSSSPHKMRTKQDLNIPPVAESK